jgi:glucose uptake protein GlcU
MLILSDRKKKTIAAGIIAAIGGIFVIKRKKNKNKID